MYELYLCNSTGTYPINFKKFFEFFSHQELFCLHKAIVIIGNELISK